MTNENPCSIQADDCTPNPCDMDSRGIVFDSDLWKLYVEMSNCQINELTKTAKAIKSGVCIEENTLNASCLLNSLKNDSAIIGLRDASSLCNETEQILKELSDIEDISTKIDQATGWLKKTIEHIQASRY